MAKTTGRILAGTASWTEDNSSRISSFYPPDIHTPEDRLRYYASRFSLVEVDSTYYAIPIERNARLWADRTPDGFTFDVKAFRLLTTHQTPPNALPKDIRSALPPLAERNRNYYYHDIPPEARDALWDRFRQSLAPLNEVGKLGLLLFQFPPWFVPGASSHKHLEEVRQKLTDYQVAVEFRHAGWLREDQVERTLALLRELRFTFVVVDEPQGFASSVPLLPEVTSSAAVLRLHGRNSSAWEAKGLASSADRFDYCYSESELRAFVSITRLLSELAEEVHVVFNNVFGKHAQDNALEFQTLVAESAAKTPPPPE